MSTIRMDALSQILIDNQEDCFSQIYNPKTTSGV